MMKLDISDEFNYDVEPDDDRRDIYKKIRKASRAITRKVDRYIIAQGLGIKAMENRRLIAIMMDIYRCVQGSHLDHLCYELRDELRSLGIELKIR